MTNPRPAEIAECIAHPKSASAAHANIENGLTDSEARRRLGTFGKNAMPDTAMHPLRRAPSKFWSPVPWMLEAAILLELALGKYAEAAIIAALLVFNAALGLIQESRAQTTLAGLDMFKLEGCSKQRIALQIDPPKSSSPLANRHLAKKVE